MDHLRQLGILNPREIIYPVTLIGCGGIGTPTALALAKMGCPDITLMDPDIVEGHNLPSQLFRLQDAGKLKAHACRDMIMEFTDSCSVKAMETAFDGSQELSGIVISAVDTMEARSKIWSKVKFNLEIPLYIDGRIGGEIIEVFTIQPSQIEDIEFYEKWLFSDEETAELPCTERAIIYVGFIIGGIIASRLKTWLKGKGGFYRRRVNFDLKTMTTIIQ